MGMLRAPQLRICAMGGCSHRHACDPYTVGCLPVAAPMACVYSFKPGVTGCTASWSVPGLKRGFSQQHIFRALLTPRPTWRSRNLLLFLHCLSGLGWLADLSRCLHMHLVGVCPVARRCLSRVGLANVHSERVTCTTLSGGSLGSCVDEERSKLCELMRSVVCLEHRHLERKLRP